MCPLSHDAAGVLSLAVVLWTAWLRTSQTGLFYTRNIQQERNLVCFTARHSIVIVMVIALEVAEATSSPRRRPLATATSMG